MKHWFRLVARTAVAAVILGTVIGICITVAGV